MSHPLVKIDKRVLARVRRICLGWPEVSEDIKWGRPHFSAGKRLFACIDRTHDRLSVSIKVTPLLQAELTEQPEWVLTPYSAHQGWITRYTDVPVDWDELTDYLRVGYRLVALKRMMVAMDEWRAHAG
jgi:predicted DNA-binding protein (MmcQ/YjbR family)